MTEFDNTCHATPWFAPEGHDARGHLCIMVERDLETGILDEQSLHEASVAINDCIGDWCGVETVEVLDPSHPAFNEIEPLCDVPHLKSITRVASRHDDNLRTQLTFDCTLSEVLAELDGVYERVMFGESVIGDYLDTHCWNGPAGITAMAAYSCSRCGAVFGGVMDDASKREHGFEYYTERPRFCPKCGSEMGSYSDGGEPGDVGPPF